MNIRFLDSSIPIAMWLILNSKISGSQWRFPILFSNFQAKSSLSLVNCCLVPPLSDSIMVSHDTEGQGERTRPLSVSSSLHNSYLGSIWRGAFWPSSSYLMKAERVATFLNLKFTGNSFPRILMNLLLGCLVSYYRLLKQSMTFFFVDL